MVLWQRKGAVIWTALVVCFAGCGSEEGDGTGGQQGRGRGGGQRSAAAVPVKVESARREEISSYVLTNTTLEAFQWVEVRSRTSGQVVAIMKEEGDTLKAGSVLARLDAEAARLQAAQMEVAFEDARRNFERAKQMYDRNLVSNEQFETSKMQMERAQAQYEQAQLNLSYTTLSSPISGVVTARNVEIGNMVTNNMLVFSVADFDPLLARIRVPEKEVGKVAVGQSARITVESVPDRTFKGRVKMISPVVDPESGTIKVTIEIPGGGRGVLRPGMFATIYIITETHENALVIPKKALVLEGEGNQIFVYETDGESGMGKAARRKVSIGFTDSDRLEVLAGLSDGERVITVGQEGLRPGSAVRLVGEGAVVASASPQEEKPAETRGGNPGGGGGGEMDAERMKQMQARMFERFPDLKKAFDKRVKEDPKLATDPKKWTAFVQEMREAGVIPARRGPQ